MLKAIVNNQLNNELTIEIGKDKTLVNQEPFNWDLLKITDNKFHIIQNNQSFEAEVIEANYEEKAFKLKINQQIHTVNLKDRTDLLLEKMGMKSVASDKLNDLKAPMPGLIFQMQVAVGDEVEKGDVLLILVAMKMENAIKATGKGKVKSIKVKVGETVDKGKIMIEFE